MFTPDQIADHPFPDLRIGKEQSEARVAAEDAARRSANYEAVQLARHRTDGWTAERQRTFLAALADTGCVSVAAATTDITPRSCYRLRRHPKAAAFARGWDEALRIAAVRKRSLRAASASVDAPSFRQMAMAIRHLHPHAFAPASPSAQSTVAQPHRA